MKISAKYWDTLLKFEKEYVQLRANIDGIRSLKIRIAAARKQFPAYTAISGKGFLTDKDGTVYLWSGDDSKKFVKI